MNLVCAKTDTRGDSDKELAQNYTQKTLCEYEDVQEDQGLRYLN